MATWATYSSTSTREGPAGTRTWQTTTTVVAQEAAVVAVARARGFPSGSAYDVLGKKTPDHTLGHGMHPDNKGRMQVVSEIAQVLRSITATSQEDALADIKQACGVSAHSEEELVCILEAGPAQLGRDVRDTLNRFMLDVQNMCRRTVSVQRLLQFTEKYDCWDWPTCVACGLPSLVLPAATSN